MHQAFKSLDKNGDGKLTAHEFKKVFERSGHQSSADVIVEALNNDGDNDVDYAEFAKGVTPKHHAITHSACKKLTFDQEFLYKQAWKRSLDELLIAMADSKI